MSEPTSGVYVASFVPIAGISYLVVKRVFTDGTYTTTDVNYAPSVEEFSYQETSAESVCYDLVAEIQGDDELTAFAEEGETLVALLECDGN